MKFLLELMSCCGSNSRTSSAKEETRLLVASVPPPSRGASRTRGVKRGRSAARSRRSGSSLGEWRPSLSSISEDNVLPERNERQGSVAAAGSPSERNLKRKVATSTSKPRSRSTGEDPGRTSIQAPMPAFSPAPFMF